MRRLGRFLQLVALIVAPLALYLQLTGVLTYGWQELVMLAGAVCIFLIGLVLQQMGS
ncbi:MAG: hypothetical protein JNM18_06175 [Planctomycetaceae bacterium]|nr:hypothetical protein [Planctomycetaceae bacterium]